MLIANTRRVCNDALDPHFTPLYPSDCAFEVVQLRSRRSFAGEVRKTIPPLSYPMLTSAVLLGPILSCFSARRQRRLLTMTTSNSDERQPLLLRDPQLNGSTHLDDSAQLKVSSEHHLGPSEMTRAARAGILAGAWMAMFFAVSLGVD